MILGIKSTDAHCEYRVTLYSHAVEKDFVGIVAMTLVCLLLVLIALLLGTCLFYFVAKSVKKTLPELKV